MPDFTVRCVSKKNGKAYSIQVPAPSQQHAEDIAAAEGHMVQPGATTSKDTAPPAAAPTDVHMEVRALRAELRDFQSQFLKTPLVRAPVWTIGWGILASGTIMFIMTAIGYIALRSLGILYQLSH